MAHVFSPDIERQLQDCMSSGCYEREDDLIRDALDALRRRDDDLTAVREAISDMEAGDRGIPFDEFVEEF